MNTIWIACIISTLIFTACSGSKETASVEERTSEEVVEENPEIEETPIEQIFSPYPTPGISYKPSQTRYFDLIHTKLAVQPVWETQQLQGNAWLTVTPYFYPQDSLVLDAKGFYVNIIQMEGGEILEYSYADSMQLVVDLPETFSRDDTFTVFISYVANPENLPSSKTGDIGGKGLYFINPLGEDEDKPTQLWTQGEPESNSVWFPTFDQPNERTTQEMFIVVDPRYKVLTNGLLVKKTNEDILPPIEPGYVTWHWKMDQPHAPYLFAMIVGEFSVVEDHWRDIAVNYYVDPEYEHTAKAVFGHTPEMMEFFSNILKVQYPWSKYHQIVVHDFVAGAMENTTATIFYEALHMTEAELQDRHMDDIIAHELIHHWFGDLVTTESWANLPLNESFATYGEYLWREYKYGRDDADYSLQKDLQAYMGEAQVKQVPLIRYYHERPGKMFDRHSYQKGGRVLHMLRKYVGDDAFFESLNLYLERQAYQPTEIHHLRLAFEEVTGQDMHWFFDQWFMKEGHPVLDLKYEYAAGQTVVTIKQSHSKGLDWHFTLPVEIALYHGNSRTKHNAIIQGPETTLFFDGRPDWIDIDAENMLLAEIEEEKSAAQWIFQYQKAELYLDRFNAIIALDETERTPGINTLMMEALEDDFWKIRELAINKVDFTEGNEKELKSILKSISETDPNSNVRAAALVKMYKALSPEMKPIYRSALKDRSYRVLSEGLFGLYLLDPKEALEHAKRFESVDEYNMIITIGQIYAEAGESPQNEYYIEKMKELEKWDKYTLITYYGSYLEKQEDLDVVYRGLNELKNIAMADDHWLFRYNVKSTIDRVKQQFELTYNEKQYNDPEGDRTQELKSFLLKVDALNEEIEGQEESSELKEIYDDQE